MTSSVASQVIFHFAGLFFGPTCIWMSLYLHAETTHWACSDLFPFFTGIGPSFLAAHDATLSRETKLERPASNYSTTLFLRCNHQSKKGREPVFVCLFVCLSCYAQSNVCHENKRHNSRRRRRRHLFGALVLLTGNPARPWLVERERKREYQRNSISITITYKFFPTPCLLALIIMPTGPPPLLSVRSAGRRPTSVNGSASFLLLLVNISPTSRVSNSLCCWAAFQSSQTCQWRRRV